MAIRWVDAPGLGAKINAAGHWVEWQYAKSGVVSIITSDDAAVQAIIDGYTVPEARAWRKRAIEEYARDLRERWREKMRWSPAEMASWFVKVREAEAYQVSPVDASAPTLALEAQQRGVSTINIVNRVIANRDAFRDVEARIAGIAGKHKDAIDAANTFAQVDAVNTTLGWPSV